MNGMQLSLDDSQFGNREGPSTVLYLVKLMHSILEEFVLGHYVNLLAIDYSKAFDRADITVAVRRRTTTKTTTTAAATTA